MKQCFRAHARYVNSTSHTTAMTHAILNSSRILKHISAIRPALRSFNSRARSPSAWALWCDLSFGPSSVSRFLRLPVRRSFQCNPLQTLLASCPSLLSSTNRLVFLRSSPPRLQTQFLLATHCLSSPRSRFLPVPSRTSQAPSSVSKCPALVLVSSPSSYPDLRNRDFHFLWRSSLGPQAYWQSSSLNDRLDSLGITTYWCPSLFISSRQSPALRPALPPALSFSFFQVHHVAVTNDISFRAFHHDTIKTRTLRHTRLRDDANDGWRF